MPTRRTLAKGVRGILSYLLCLTLLVPTVLFQSGGTALAATWTLKTAGSTNSMVSATTAACGWRSASLGLTQRQPTVA